MIALIGILAGVLITIIDPTTQIQKTNDAKRKSELRQLQIGLQGYYQDHGRYPTHTPSYEITGGAWGAVGMWEPYINVVPIDPKAPSKTFVYYADPTGQAYFLYASLDRDTSDPQRCKPGPACSSLIVNSIPSTACGGTCNFGLSSPNVSP